MHTSSDASFRTVKKTLEL